MMSPSQIHGPKRTSSDLRIDFMTSPPHAGESKSSCGAIRPRDLTPGFQARFELRIADRLPERRRLMSPVEVPWASKLVTGPRLLVAAVSSSASFRPVRHH